MKDNNEQINHPSHYGGESNPYEAIKIIKALGLDFCLGNTLKYIARAGKKDKAKEIEDLKKASWYLQEKIKDLEKFGTLVDTNLKPTNDLDQWYIAHKFKPPVDLIVDIRLEDNREVTGICDKNGLWKINQNDFRKPIEVIKFWKYQKHQTQ